MTATPHISPDIDTAATMLQSGEHVLLWTRLVTDMETPVSAMQKLAKDDTPSFLLESVHGGESRGRYSLLGLYPDRLWRCHGDKAEICKPLESDNFTALPAKSLDALNAEIEAIRMDIPEGLPSMATGLIGYFGYDMIKQVEVIAHNNPDSIGIPDACLMRPRLTLIFDNVDGVLYACAPVWKDAPDARIAYENAASLIKDTLATLEQSESHRTYFDPDASTTLNFTSNVTRASYHEMVEKAKEYIRAGDIFQVVPSQRFSTKFTPHPFHLYRALRYRNPSPFLFYLNMGSFSLVGSSPEILVRLRDDTITVRPIAGTRPRGETAAKDEALHDELLADPKEIAEHLMLLDLGRNDVGRAAKDGTVKVTEQMIVERYSHVMHIVSNVEGIKRDDATPVDCLMSGFPAGTVSGAPKIRAMDIIDELEPVSRSFYAGGVGYFSASGWMDTCITLRTALIKDEMLYVQAGGGVVYDSDPDGEYQESCNKAKAIMSAAELAMQFAETNHA